MSKNSFDQEIEQVDVENMDDERKLTGAEWKAVVDAKAKKYARETNNVKKSKSGKRTPLDYLFGVVGILAVILGSILGAIYYYKFGFRFEDKYAEIEGILLFLLSYLTGGVFAVINGIIGLVWSEAHDGRGKMISGVAIILSILFLMVATLWLASGLILIASKV